MFDLNKEWSISFAGCGFMGIYYVGASGCILEHFPRLIQDASKIYGASAGALMAAILTIGIPIGECWQLYSTLKCIHKSVSFRISDVFGKHTYVVEHDLSRFLNECDSLLHAAVIFFSDKLFSLI